MLNAETLFKDKEKINIVFLGGSITQGAGSSDVSKCFANMTGEWFKKTFGADKVNYYNKGVGGTPSFYGLLRLQRDVISCNPDMVFVEFAVNDTGTDSRIYLEGIIRSLLKLPNKPYIVFLYTTDKNYTTPTENFEQVAEYYGIPQISLKEALKNELSGNDAFEAGYLKDAVHPSDKGYEVYYNEMVRCLQKEEYYKKPLEKEKMFEDSFGANTKFVHVTELEYDCGWTKTVMEERTGLLAEKENQVLEFEFDGNILAFEHGLHPDSGVYNIYVDGELIGTGDPYYENIGNANQLVFGFRTTDLPDGHHKVKLETAKGEHGGTRIMLYHVIMGNKE